METERSDEGFQERRLTMTRNTTLTTFGLLAALAGASIAPAMANEQSDKNNARNLALGGVAVAAYGLFTHNNAATLLGAAGAALAGSQYEHDRQQQSQDSGRFYHYNNYGNGGYNNYNNGGYDHNGYNRDGYNRDGYNRNGVDRDGDNQDGRNRGGDNQNRSNQNQQRDQNWNNLHQDQNNSHWDDNRGDR